MTPATSVTKPKVLIIGSGGVGTISALSLTTNNKCEVTLVVRSDYELISTKGYSINSCTYGELTNWKPHNVAKSVTDAAERFGPFDYILVTTKNIPDASITCEQIIKPAVDSSPESVIILLQNGLGVEKPMYAAFPNHLVLSGISHIGSTYYHGHVDNKGPDNVFLGDFNPEGKRHPLSQSKIEEFISIYQNPDNKNKIVLDENVQKTRWEKLIYNSVFNTITALVNLDVTRLQINGVNEDLIRPAMLEVIAIAKSVGVECDASKVDKFIHIGDGLFYAPSMCIDMRKGQLMELEIILGNPMRIARENGVSTPILSVIYSLLKMVQFRIKEERGMFELNQEDFKGNSDDYARIFHDKYV
ncbi:uncharacterized protein SPAPADRAFT_58524 [Spathaspora passalidarum NRRL Y-27907]|uniref:2-dehydropantoate 2-reductase n=1 Tax=Spathaspora passalidarum (strain NRRL Y-27907 / 11-Y1) TaxID=619300 RepID=G3AGG3_SPAPN|nr:uncharacterized protein SPAPADRAFT_58524 [Spathaspora passalidarum NRRL Y-27907]EGW35302.1 hypothetical protein SPAPADRAFT_58524 [Spathaspora passalidarum NRRL Y-27907]